MNEVLKNIRARHSVRTYTQRQVSDADLALILEAATMAPNGMHLETWHFTAIQNPVIITLPLWFLFPTSLLSGGLAWIVPARWRICFWQPLLWVSALVGLTR